MDGFDLGQTEQHTVVCCGRTELIGSNWIGRTHGQTFVLTNEIRSYVIAATNGGDERYDEYGIALSRAFMLHSS